jgi:hypothetical protein
VNLSSVVCIKRNTDDNVTLHLVTGETLAGADQSFDVVADTLRAYSMLVQPEEHFDLARAR